MTLSKSDVLCSMNFGQRVAEEEADHLHTYFVETEDWRKLYSGEVDVIYGSKGAGKSALYSLIQLKQCDLNTRGVFIISAENPRGATAFRGLVTDAPANERDFMFLWKLYFLSLLYKALEENGIKNEFSEKVRQALEKNGLIKRGTLAALLAAVKGYVNKYSSPTTVEPTVSLEPTTVSFSAKITFEDPGHSHGHEKDQSVDSLFELVEQALNKEGKKVWILLDRLDVAFLENEELEISALRALFRVYLDLAAMTSFKIKIFLRTDIWARITESGFREASHITRHLTISWNKTSLLCLVVKRALFNEKVKEHYGVSDTLLKSSIAEQEEFFYRVFPRQVDIGQNKSNSFDWMLSRTRDGSKLNAPRELIHMLNSLRDQQIKRFELGEEPQPDGENLFARAAFKAALPEVSKVRVEQTLYAEHADKKPWIEDLREERTLHTVTSLASIWDIPEEEATKRVEKLVSIGFFEKRGSKQAPDYWVPFLFRDYLSLIQGAAEAD
ncbi:TPA: P-loop ATPase, Sll1717 family [Aeromonas veronii]|uniref:P-loop ATPase, Sll1717 family n=1 Tax=Aeromonas veronii TaxID=654 RepID=UPI003D205306